MFINTQTLAYPIGINEIKQRFPNVSFPSSITDQELISFGYASVYSTPPPSCNSDESLEEGVPSLVNGQWKQTWKKRPATNDELLGRCNYYAFWNALLISSVYQTIRAQAIQSLEVNTCCTEFIAAIADAKAGQANKNALQTCIWLLMAALTLTTQERNELQNVLAAGNLDKVYSLIPA